MPSSSNYRCFSGIDQKFGENDSWYINNNKWRVTTQSASSRMYKLSARMTIRTQSQKSYNIKSNNNDIYFCSAISIAVRWRFTKAITLKKIIKLCVKIYNVIKMNKDINKIK